MAKTLAEALGQRLRTLLHRKHWSQRTLAQRLGTTQGAISYLVSGKRRGDALDYYQKIAQVAFGMRLSDLVRLLERQVDEDTAAAEAEAEDAQDRAISLGPTQTTVEDLIEARLLLYEARITRSLQQSLIEQLATLRAARDGDDPGLSRARNARQHATGADPVAGGVAHATPKHRRSATTDHRRAIS